MADWKKMANGRKMIEHPAGFLMIVPEQHPPIVPVECNVCGFLMKDFMDLVEHKRHECCYNCSLKWAQPNSVSWKNGWRPSEEEIMQETKRRKSLPSYNYQVR